MFKWRDEFSVNVESVDLQHKELFRIGNMLYDVISIKDDVDSYDEIVMILQEMKDYAVYHFHYEEKLMKENGYPGFEKHKKQHDAFVEKINSIDEGDIDRKQQKVSMDLVIFIANWIENHILKTDMEYRDFLNEKGIY